MKILEEAFRHPTQASEVRLEVYEQPEGGYLVTEDRLGTAKVVATLGLFDDRQAALDRARRRAAELERQRYRKIAPAA